MRKSLLSRIAPGVVGSFAAYAAICIGMGATQIVPMRIISEEQAKNILNEEQKQPYLDGKKINFIPVSLLDFHEGCGGCMYSANGEYNIVMPRNFIDKKALLHEIAHTIGTKPDTTHVEFSIDWLNRELDKTIDTPVKIAGYVLSPKELFCNTYGLVRSWKY